MFKRAKVVMLSTNEKAHFRDIILTPDTNKLLIFYHQNCTEVAQHLYVTSDEEIKEDDWCVNINNEEVHQCLSVYECKDCKKIIAATDASLKIFRGCINEIMGNDIYEPLPQLSQQYIEEWIEEYNKDNVITDILVEYEISKNKNFIDGNIPSMHGEEIIKVNPKDNTITIKKVKDSWSREEVIDLISDWTRRKSGLNINLPDNFNDWIEQNL